eukprot:m.59060 g.59060  ORF g.59060 m.59060 type:complete len:194 (-) comp15957_c0_seq6:47-628(-)
MALAMTARKLVAVGDGACGKTSFLIVFSKNTFPEDYVPTVFENYVAAADVDGHQYEVALWDTAGQEDYAHIRPLSYDECSCFMICFSVDNRDSFENVDSKWVPEIQNYSRRTPFILVGLKRDLRTDAGALAAVKARSSSMVTPDEGVNMALRVGAFGYCECSAKDRDNVSEVIATAVRASLAKKLDGSCCTLL